MTFKEIRELILRVDRVQHFFVGTLIFLFVSAFTDNLFGLGTVTLIAILKELNDKYIKKTNFDIWDLLYTILSGILITLIELWQVR